MRKLLFTLLITLLITAGTYGLSRADNGPHGNYSASTTTDSCSGCHRAHTGAAQKLLMVSTASLCESCHGPAGTGADTDVWDGEYLTRDATTENPAEGIQNRGLKAGGFVNSVMDTSLAGSAASAPSTSSHTFNGTPGMIWGNGAIGTGAGSSVAMDCGSCHNPHGKAANGTATYRILRPIPQGSGAASGVVLADVTSKSYTVDSAAGNYWGQNYGTTETSLSQWCATCHTRYLAGDGAENTSSGDPIFNFRHRTDGAGGVNCIDCHVAHGSSAKMGPNSGSVAWPDSSTSPSGDNRSSLLRLDNRGVCVQCHQNP